MIALDRLSFAYPAQPPLFEHLSASFGDGRITAVVGPNGSGKSTLLRLSARLLTPDSGTVRIGGQPAPAYAPKALARTLAFLPQSRPVPMITVRALVAHGRFPHLGMARRLTARDEAAVDRALAAAGLCELAGRDLRTLSGGQRQKAYLAMLIAQDAQHLLLDEPMTALDIAHQLELGRLLAALRDEGRCIVLVVHDLAAAVHLADDALLLHRGRVLFSGRANALLGSGTIEQAFGVKPVYGAGVRFEPLT